MQRAGGGSFRSLLVGAPLAFLIGFLIVWGLLELAPGQTQPRALLAGASVQTLAARGGDITGRASVIDGDTIRVGGESVRLNGIDAPESRQTCTDERGASYRCGAVAARALDTFLAASRPVRCAFVSRDQYGRFVGECFRADGESVAAWLVRNGHALDWPRFSNGRYAGDQRAAQRERRGLWRGSFQPPWEWRAGNR